MLSNFGSFTPSPPAEAGSLPQQWSFVGTILPHGEGMSEEEGEEKENLKWLVMWEFHIEWASRGGPRKDSCWSCIILYHGGHMLAFNESETVLNASVSVSIVGAYKGNRRERERTITAPPLGTQIVLHPPAASASPKSLLEMPAHRYQVRTCILTDPRQFLGTLKFKKTTTLGFRGQ